MATKKKGRSRLQEHLDGECGCRITVNPNNCVYQVFPDGWSFVPDVGNGQVRGEIFTPRFIVDKMIVDSGMLPSSAVREYSYDGDPDTIRSYISSRVVEPAIGTGNFSSVILHHKLHYANSLAQGNREELDRLFTEAVASMYSYDIDPGNLEVSKRRMLDGDASPLNDDTTRDYWVQYLTDILGEEQEESILKMVGESLDAAQIGWHSFLDGQGVVTRLYREFTGEDMSDNMINTMTLIMNDNMKLFNGLSEESSNILPGWGTVVWTWWKDGVADNRISMKKQITSSLLQRKEEEMESFRKEHYVIHSSSEQDDDVDSLFSDLVENVVETPVWDSKSSERKYRKMERERDKLATELSELEV